jgi:mRNA-degrading endonuclease RelE of RelBE toxin-antitoxin system
MSANGRKIITTSLPAEELAELDRVSRGQHMRRCGRRSAGMSAHSGTCRRPKRRHRMKSRRSAPARRNCRVGRPEASKTCSVTWDCRLGSQAERTLRRMRGRDRDRINRELNEMKTSPFGGDTVPPRGEHQGAFRRRVGSWRIIFSVRPDFRVVLIHDILRRTSTTY